MTVVLATHLPPDVVRSLTLGEYQALGRIMARAKRGG